MTSNSLHDTQIGSSSGLQDETNATLLLGLAINQVSRNGEFVAILYTTLDVLERLYLVVVYQKRLLGHLHESVGMQSHLRPSLTTSSAI